MLDSGINPDERAGDMEETALYTAVRSGNTQSVLLLLEHGADPALGAPGYYSVLHLAAQENKYEFVDLLFQKRPDLASNAYLISDLSRYIILINQPRELAHIPGYTSPGPGLIDYACRESNVSRGTIIALIDAGAPLNTPGENNQTPFFHYRCYLDEQIVQRAMAKGLNLNLRDRQERTILYYAAYSKSLDAVKYLLRAGAMPDDSLVVHFEESDIVREKIHYYDTGPGRHSGYRTRDENRTVRRIYDIPLIDYAKEKDQELYRMLTK